MRRLLALVVLLAAIGAGAWWIWLRPPAATVATVARGSVAEIVYANGTVEPERFARVLPLVRERIVWICDCEGAKVEAGAPLARLDDREARARLDELEARRDIAKKQLDRQSDLLSRRTVSQDAYDQSASALAQIEAAVAAQDKQLGNYTLAAPIAGIVLREDARIGEIAEVGAQLYAVGEARPLRIVAEVNEEDVLRIAVGQRVLIRADAVRDRRLEGTLSEITPMGNVATKTWRVHVGLPDDTPLLVGMSPEINIVVKAKDSALTVPAAALRGDTAFVVKDDGRLEQRRVALGVAGARAVEIVGGLAEGERVLAPLVAGASDGGRVRVTGTLPSAGDGASRFGGGPGATGGAGRGGRAL